MNCDAAFADPTSLAAKRPRIDTGGAAQPDAAAASTDWFGSSDDDEAPPLASIEPPGPRGEVWKKHLSASWLPMWLKLDSFDGTTKGRQALLDEKLAPRARVKTGKPNPRLERGKQEEPKTREAFAKLAGLEMGVDVTKAPLAEHPEHPYIAAKADGLIGDDGVLEIKTPWSARTDDNVEVTLETKHLLQVYTQMECYDRDYAIVLMGACGGEWLHVWKIYRDCPEYHCVTHGELPLWQTMLPELKKYATAMRNGGTVHPIAGQITVKTQDNIGAALHRWSRQAVHKLCVHEPSPQSRFGFPYVVCTGWKQACAERNNTPEFTLVDGFGAMFGAMDGALTLRRFARVWWRFENGASATPKVFVPDPNKPVTSGGYIRPEYWHAAMAVTGLKKRELWIP